MLGQDVILSQRERNARERIERLQKRSENLSSKRKQKKMRDNEIV